MHDLWKIVNVVKIVVLGSWQEYEVFHPIHVDLSCFQIYENELEVLTVDYTS